MAEAPILIIGASFANGNTPIDDNLNAPLGGISVGFGSYLSLGNALVRNPKLSGNVINEAQAGATTFTRIACNPVCVPGVEWQSYDIQLTKALKRVSFPPLGILNAKYVFISFSNDCLHSDAFGVDMTTTSQCSVNEMELHADTMVALGQRAVAEGLIPVFLKVPNYDDFDLVKFQAAAGLLWVQDKANYEQLTDIRRQRITNEVPEAVLLEIWKRYRPLDDDGLHPDTKTVKRAAKVIARFIKRNDRIDDQNDD